MSPSYVKVSSSDEDEDEDQPEAVRSAPNTTDDRLYIQFSA